VLCCSSHDMTHSLFVVHHRNDTFESVCRMDGFGEVRGGEGRVCCAATQPRSIGLRPLSSGVGRCRMDVFGGGIDRAGGSYAQDILLPPSRSRLIDPVRPSIHPSNHPPIDPSGRPPIHPHSVHNTHLWKQCWQGSLSALAPTSCASMHTAPVLW
jgi:hypothetical protein